MKYIDGLAIGAGTVLGVLVSILFSLELAMCLSLGVCSGLLVDFVVRRVGGDAAKDDGKP